MNLTNESTPTFKVIVLFILIRSFLFLDEKQRTKRIRPGGFFGTLLLDQAKRKYNTSG
jgi:hypothetical protein